MSERARGALRTRAAIGVLDRCEIGVGAPSDEAGTRRRRHDARAVPVAVVRLCATRRRRFTRTQYRGKRDERNAKHGPGIRYRLCLKQLNTRTRFRPLRTVPRGRGSHGRLCLRLPWHDNRLRGGFSFRPHGLQGLRPPAAACSELSRVAAVINSRPVIRTGPGVPHGFGLQLLGTARPKPAINFRSLRGIARQAITTTKNHSIFAAARLTSST